MEKLFKINYKNILLSTIGDKKKIQFIPFVLFSDNLIYYTEFKIIKRV